MLRNLIIRIKIWLLFRKFRDIDSEIWSNYLSLNYRNIKYFGGKIDIDYEQQKFKKLKEKEKYLIAKKIQDLKSKLKNPDR